MVSYLWKISLIGFASSALPYVWTGFPPATAACIFFFRLLTIITFILGGFWAVGTRALSFVLTDFSFALSFWLAISTCFCSFINYIVSFVLNSKWKFSNLQVSIFLKILLFVFYTSSFSSFNEANVEDLSREDFGGYMQSITQTNNSPRNAPINIVATANIK